MTLPIEINLPVYEPPPDAQDNEDEEQDEQDDQLTPYLRELVQRLEKMYEDMTQEINGRTEKFNPVIKDSVTDATYEYPDGGQEGWFLRQGLLVDYWFDVTWSAIATGTPTGNLYIELPYVVFDAQQKPFVGVLQTSTLAYGAGLTTLTVNAIPGTTRAEIWGSGTGVPEANVTADTAAGQLIGHVRYVGEEFE